MSFKVLGADVRAEEMASRGRSDMVLFHEGRVFVMEPRMAESEEEPKTALDRAIAQLREKGYGDRYRHRGEPIHHVAICFGRGERNLLMIRSRCPEASQTMTVD